ncbi:O-antigen ligase [Rathayibacter sp. PhB152]|uniref:O-antigen ligase family protein n=1 Tax=Rathayibacter sp. PhB152 TaxID=2485190 RepID=UPI0011CDBD84|nr:O-antigen ligase family protein [Rathayibacter sp. PhB152]
MGKILAKGAFAVAGLAAVFSIAMFVLGPGFTLLGLCGLVAVLLLLRFPTLGLYLLIVLVPFNGLITQLAEGNAIGTAYGASKDAILLGLLVVAIVSGKIRRVPGWLLALVALMVTVPLISAVFSPSVGQASYGWRNDYEPLLMLLVVPALIESRSIPRLLATFVAVMEIAAATAVITWNRGLPWLTEIGRLPVANRDDFPTSLFSSGSDRPRAFSPFVAPNEMAVVMAATIAVVWLIPRLRTSHRLLLTVLPMVAVMLSESRSGILGLVVVLCVLAARGIHRRSPLLTGAFVVIAVVGVFAGAFLYISNRLGDAGDPSVGGHSLSLEAGIRTLLENPLGLGLGVVGPRAAQYEDSYHVESFLLLLALESGVAVLVIYIALMWRISRVSLRAGSDGVAFLPIAVLSATMVSQMVLPTFQEGAVSFLIWLLVGVGLTGVFARSSALVVEDTPGLGRRAGRNFAGPRRTGTASSRYRGQHV